MSSDQFHEDADTRMSRVPEKSEPAGGGRSDVPEEDDVLYAPGASTLTETRDLTVLVWERDRVDQAGTEVMLAGRGHRVTTVKDLEAAKKALSEGAYDLVLVDLDMFESDGLPAVRDLKSGEIEAGRTTRVVAMTSDMETYSRRTCLDAGLDGHLRKPFLAAALMDEFERLF